MAQGNSGNPNLVKLDDFEGELEEYWEDIRGHKVLDKNGDEIGTVEDLYIYEDASAVHILKVSDEGVEVEQPKDTIVGSPEFDSEDVPDLETSRAVYQHFGYPDQLALGGE